MKTTLESLIEPAYAWFEQELAQAPYCTVEYHGSRERFLSIRSEHGNAVIIPAKPGIYVVYHRDATIPFYAGEAKNLKQRISYHFRKAPSTLGGSTLCKVAKALGHLDSSTSLSQSTRFKFVEVPFGRKELEVAFHAKHRINTQKGKIS